MIKATSARLPLAVSRPRQQLALCRVVPRTGRSIIARFRPAAQKPEITSSVKKTNLLAEDAVQPAGVATDSPHQLEPATGSQTPQFVWTQFWLPVSPVSYMDKTRPTAHRLLGQPLAVWYSEATDTWNVMQDQCPHRLAPLSEGRIVDSNILCSYHGWQFEPSGQCVSIPQVNPAQKAAACANKRSCATAYPARVHQGVLYVWLDNSPKGLELSKVRGITSFTGTMAGPAVMSESPIDARLWLEQGWDPTHANFLHHAGGFLMENACFMPTWRVSKVDLNNGFSMEHGGYETRNVGMKATRVFVPPCHNVFVYRKPTATIATHISILPVTPGKCRFVGQMQFLPPGQEPTLLANGQPQDISFTSAAEQQKAEAPPAAATKKGKPKGVSLATKLQVLVAILKLPHWAYVRELAQTDEDVVIMAQMERNMAERGQSFRNYHSVSKDADIGVVQMNRWLNLAGYPAAAFPGLDVTNMVKPGDAVHLESLLDRRTHHVNHCVICQEGEKLVTKLCWGISFAAGLLATFSTALAAQTAWSALQGASIRAGALVPTAGLMLFSGILALAAFNLWSFREFVFINGANGWRRAGGLSLIPRV